MTEVKEIEDVRCPKCDSEDFSTLQIEHTGFTNYIIISYKCKDCGTMFYVEYTAINIKAIEK